jgi:hypothetical protein
MRLPACFDPELQEIGASFCAHRVVGQLIISHNGHDTGTLPGPHWHREGSAEVLGPPSCRLQLPP